MEKQSYSKSWNRFKLCLVIDFKLSRCAVVSILNLFVIHFLWCDFGNITLNGARGTPYPTPTLTIQLTTNQHFYLLYWSSDHYFWWLVDLLLTPWVEALGRHPSYKTRWSGSNLTRVEIWWAQAQAWAFARKYKGYDIIFSCILVIKN